MEQFVERFERPRIPVVITGLCDGWRAGDAWQQQDLLKHYGEHKFKVASLCVALWLESVCYRDLQALQHITLLKRRCCAACHDDRACDSLVKILGFYNLKFIL